jgi:hypothetical protein
MTLQPLSPNFLIKVLKEEEMNKREMDGSLYLHPNFVWLTRNTQCGIIEGISPEANKQLPEAMIGDMLLVHHFVQRSHETKSDNDKFLAYEDEQYKYYNVVSKEIPGSNNMTYGVYRNGEIIPHPQYVFLEKEIENKDGWYQTPEEIFAKLEEIKNFITYRTKNGLTEETIMQVKKKEAEMMELNLSLQTKEYLPYKIAFANKSLGLENGSIVFALNIATQTIVNYNGIDYRVCDTKYLGAV